jgi:hypothetical protein
MPELWESAPSKDSTAPDRFAAPLVVDDLPVDREIADGEMFLIRNGESRYLTHLFHKYPGKFIPHIPRWALRRFTRAERGAVILDPFAGSGTTLVEAALHGQSAYGVDVDPLARLIAKVKTTPIPASRLQTLPDEVAAAVDAKAAGSFRPSIPTLSHWFTDEAISDLSSIHDVVEDYGDERDVHDFLLVCLSSIIRRSSNADNQTMKTYVSHTNPKEPERARPLFLRTVLDYSRRLMKLGRLVPATASTRVFTGDACHIGDLWRQEGLPPADLAISSPPYIKSVDYIYNQMAELFWIGQRWGLETQQKQNQFKRNYIGNDRPPPNRTSQPHTVGLIEIDQYIDQVLAASRQTAFVMSQYFRDMAAHLAEMRGVLRSGAHYILVIGDSTVAGVPIPTHDLIASLGRHTGFGLCGQFAYEIRNKYMHFPRGGRGGVVLHDWIIDLVNE